MKNPFNPDNSTIWQELAGQQQRLDQTSLVELFNKDPRRFETMHTSAAGLTLDYSRNLIDTATLDLLVRAAEGCGLEDRIRDLTSGVSVNTTENRPALHTVLRDFSGQSRYHGEVEAVMQQMRSLVEQVHTGVWKGCTGKTITDIVNLGIGGSHLGPMFATDALVACNDGSVNCHFVSNIDSNDLYRVIATLEPDTTLFIIASKSFTTQETLQNAKTARAWTASIAKNEADYGRHFIAVTSRPDKAIEFGVARENILPMWDWVGGRYSLWSAIGLPVAFSTGMDNFNRLRRGAAAMDEHFMSAPFRHNLPVLLALLGIWYVNFWGTRSHAVLPYMHYLRYLPEFLQQLDMESNGKSVRLDNRPVDYQTASVLWGTVETNGQHSFHQMLHQGTQLIPADFIVGLQPDTADDTHHAYLFANCLAQMNALMVGKSLAQAQTELKAAGRSPAEIESLALHMQMPGNRPSNLILMDRLTPETLGALIALYEHKVFVQSVIWNINAFDQWGVELGKVIGNRIYGRLTSDNSSDRFDAATEGAISLYRNRTEKK
jgi:glucose-6-phosphate isomerase